MLLRPHNSCPQNNSESYKTQARLHITTNTQSTLAHNKTSLKFEGLVAR